MTQNNNVLQPTVDMGEIEEKLGETKQNQAEKKSNPSQTPVAPPNEAVVSSDGGKTQTPNTSIKSEVSDDEADVFFASHVSRVSKLLATIDKGEEAVETQSANPHLQEDAEKSAIHDAEQSPVSIVDHLTMTDKKTQSSAVSEASSLDTKPSTQNDIIKTKPEETVEEPENMIDKIEHLADAEIVTKNEVVNSEAVGVVSSRDKAEARAISETATVPAGTYKFPKGFLWGTSTSAYQVEGGIKNDWSEWETSDKQLAHYERKGLNKETYICGDAVNHYHLYKEDIDRAVSLNNNAIRIGIEWARIQPKKDTWDVTAINHYRDVLEYAQEKGLETIVTLWHWTNPIWVSEEKGWANKKVITYFGEYVDFVIRELGGQIDYWVTLNEPLMHVFGGYLKGYFPPGKHNPIYAENVFWNLIRGHIEAYKKIHSHFPKARVSVTALINFIEPANKYNPIERALAGGFHYFWNHRFLKKCEKYLDFIGLDYYFHDRIVWYPPFKKNLNERVNDKGWEIYPQGILGALRYLKQFKKPIYIMENGLSDRTDMSRAGFIQDHLYYVHQAIEEGIDVRGYFHWSLLDNFEWAYGWTMCFGLYEVNRETMERVERPSAGVYRRICGGNELVI